jgi:hypothetical protein
VHFDLYRHNILLTAGQVFFVDWPHARLGAPFLDLVILFSSAAAAGIDPEPILHDQPLIADTDPRVIDAVVAALAGFCLAGGLYPAPPGMEPVTNAQVAIGRGGVEWLARRLSRRNP